MRHDLKTWPEYFDAVRRGDKLFEVRMMDRPFCKGDMLLLQKYEPESKTFSGDTLTCLVTYVLTGGQFGVEQGFCVMGIKVTGSRIANTRLDRQEEAR